MVIKSFIFTEPPADFSPKVEAAGCYCEFEDKILLLKRLPTKPQGNTWCVPGGKLEKTEDARAAVIREVFEEVGLQIDDAELEKLGTLHIRQPEYDYVFHIFRKKFTDYPSINLGLGEHLDAKWVTIPQALELPLIAAGEEALGYYQMWLSKKT